MSSEEPARCKLTKRKAGLLDEPRRVQPRARKKIKRSKVSKAKLADSGLLLSMQGFDEVTRCIMLEVDAEESAALCPKRVGAVARRAVRNTFVNLDGSKELASEPAAVAAAAAPQSSTRFQACALQTLQHATESFLSNIAEYVRDDVVHSNPPSKRATTKHFIRAEAALRPGVRSQNSNKLQQAWEEYCDNAGGGVDIRNKCKLLSEKGFNKILQCSKSFQVRRGESQLSRESVPAYLRFAASCFVRDVLRAAAIVMRHRRHKGSSYCMRGDDIKEGVRQAFGRISYNA